MKRHDDRRADRAPGGHIKTIVTAALIATVLASGAAMMAAARTVDLAPKVGDILVFRTEARLPADWEFNAVTLSDQLPVSCRLQPAVMASAGGSLVVEQRSNDARTYRVHWAGRETSGTGTDCGGSADLLMSRADLQLLSNAVGGPGVDRRTLGGF
jgi:hypothetical protein